MIEGLKVTMTGVQLRSNLDERIHWHQAQIQRMLKQLRTPDRPVEECPYTDDVLESEISRAETRIDVLTFIREYIVADEVYRLGEFDLRFADLLPEEEWDCGSAPPGLRRGSAVPGIESEPH